MKNLKEESVVELIKEKLGAHWALRTVTSAQLSSWMQIPTGDAKDILDKFCLHKKAVRAGRESAKNKIEWNGTTCIQYHLLEDKSDKDFPVGSIVKHPKLGNGEVVFSKPEFPKMRVIFGGVEHRVLKGDVA